MAERLTDAEVMKWAESCIDPNNDCDTCWYDGGGCRFELIQDLLSIVNRNLVEIEHLNKVVQITAECAYESRQMAMKWARAEAIKEFAERLKAKQKQINITYNLDYDVVFVSDIDDVAKEMVGVHDE